MKFLSYLGIGEKENQEEYAYHETLANVMLVISMVILALFSVVHTVYEEYVMASVQVLLCIVYAITYFNPFKNITMRFKENAVVLGTILLFWFLLIDGGIAKTGIYWVPFFPFMLFAVAGIHRGIRWVSLFVVGIAVIEFLYYMGVVNMPYSSQEMICFSLAFLFYIIVAMVFEALRTRQQHELSKKNVSLVDIREKLNKTLNNLEYEIENRTSELKRSNKKLAEEIKSHQSTNQDLQETEQKFFQAQKMEALGTLVGGIAHDFNNVMSGISANLFYIQREIKGNPLVQDKLDDVEKLVFHASEMSKQLLTFARKDEVEKTHFDMSSFINEAVKLGAVSLTSRIRLEKDLTQVPLPILGSATQLQQVLMNLLGNARDALSMVETPSIRIVLKALDEAKHLRSKHPKLEGKWMYLSIRDNGAGIPESNLAHVFEPFFTTKQDGKGTGLGLAMCYGAIQSHGGVIEVESKPDDGCVFHIYLPLEVDDKSDYDGVKQELMGNGETLLIVDDDKALRIAHHSVLEKLNYHVLEASDGKEAIKIYAQEKAKIDLVMMDSMMPNMSGIKAAEHILLMNKDAKIFFATGYEKNSTTERWLSGGSKQIESIRRLNKPFTIEQLCKVIREELD